MYNIEVKDKYKLYFDESNNIRVLSTFYINRVSTSPESEHVLDDEDQVEPLSRVSLINVRKILSCKRKSKSVVYAAI